MQSIPWSGRYVFDDDIIRYVSIENRKSAVDNDQITETSLNAQGDSKLESTQTNKHGPSILVHTSVPFGIQHKNTDETEVYKMIQKHLDMVLPNLGTQKKQNELLLSKSFECYFYIFHNENRSILTKFFH